MLAGLPSLAEWARVHGARPGHLTVLHSDGRVVPEVNVFFASPRMRVCAARTVRHYAYALGIWMGFWSRPAGSGMGRRRGRGRVQVLADDHPTRRTPARVAGSTLLGNLIAIHASTSGLGRRLGRRARARGNNRFLDRRIADLEAELADRLLADELRLDDLLVEFDVRAPPDEHPDQPHRHRPLN